MRRLVVSMIVGTTLMGCRGAADSSGTAVRQPGVRDSAGVRIHTHSAGDLARAPEHVVDTTPITRADGRQADVNFQSVHDAVLLPDGRIAALQWVNPRLYILGQDGRRQRVIGRRGKGPGDFTAPAGMLLVGRDSLYVADGANGRVNWIDADRGFIGAVPMRLIGMSTCERPQGMLDDRRVVFLFVCLRHELHPRPPVALEVGQLDRSAIALVDSLPAEEMISFETWYLGERGTERRPLRLGRRSHVAAWDSTIAVGRNTSAYEIDRVAPDGRILARIRVNRPRRAVTVAMRDATIAAELERVSHLSGESGAYDMNELRRFARESPFADSLPHYSRFHVTPDRTLWVMDPTVPGETGWSALAFRPDGSIAGRLSAPRAGVVLAFGEDRVLVREEDADGIWHLVVYPIRPR